MTLKVIKHVKKNFLVFSPIALFWLIIIDIAEGMAPEERVSKREKTGKTNWYSPMPSGPKILLRGMR